MTTKPKPLPEPIPARAPDPQAGYPEGVEPGASGALAEPLGAPSTPASASAPLVADLHLDNSTEADQSPLATPGHGDGYGTDGYADQALARLGAHLQAHHPEEPLDVHVADVAVRLLTRYAAHTPAVTRCPESYCNLPAGHATEHGWVHVEPRG